MSCGLEEIGDLGLIESALDKVLAVGDAYLEAPDAEEALAAAETIARLLGRWGPLTPYTETMDKWVERVKLVPDPKLVERVIAAIGRILSEPLELLERWQDSDEVENWKMSIEDLRLRVQG